jgi:hypothetical protein
MAARDVVLPVPVPPTKITSPRLDMVMSFSTGGRPRDSKVGIFMRDGPQHQPDLPLLDEGVGPEAPDARRRDGEVALFGGFELLGLTIAHDHPGQLRGVGVGELLVGLGNDLAVDLDGRRKVGGDEKVRAVLLHIRRRRSCMNLSA